MASIVVAVLLTVGLPVPPTTDALATGQALYALGTAGAGGDDPAVRRGWYYLAAAQQKDGSWLVQSRNPNAHPPVISYFATDWATLGLVRTLPAAPHRPG